MVLKSWSQRKQVRCASFMVAFWGCVFENIRWKSAVHNQNQKFQTAFSGSEPTSQGRISPFVFSSGKAEIESGDSTQRKVLENQTENSLQKKYPNPSAYPWYIWFLWSFRSHWIKSLWFVFPQTFAAPQTTSWQRAWSVLVWTHESTLLVAPRVSEESDLSANKHITYNKSPLCRNPLLSSALSAAQ